MAKDKKRDGKKSEKSVPPVPAHSAAAESSPTKLTALHASADGAEEAQASAAVLDKEPEKAEEAPVQDVPPYYKEPILAQLVVKRYVWYRPDGEIGNSCSGIPDVHATRHRNSA